MSKKGKRFWFHYNKPESLKRKTNILTIHHNDKCNIVNSIECNVPIESHDRKEQPRCILRGWANSIVYKWNENKVKAIIN